MTIGSSGLQLDADGDLVLHLPSHSSLDSSHKDYEWLTIVHEMETPLHNVGLQVPFQIAFKPHTIVYALFAFI